MNNFKGNNDSNKQEYKEKEENVDDIKRNAAESITNKDLRITPNSSLLYHIIYRYGRHALHALGRLIAEIIKSKQISCNVVKKLQDNKPTYIHEPPIHKWLNLEHAILPRSLILANIIFAFVYEPKIKILLLGFNRLNDALGVPAPSTQFNRTAIPHLEKSVQDYVTKEATENGHNAWFNRILSVNSSNNNNDIISKLVTDEEIETFFEQIKLRVVIWDFERESRFAMAFFEELKSYHQAINSIHSMV